MDLVTGMRDKLGESSTSGNRRPEACLRITQVLGVASGQTSGQDEYLVLSVYHNNSAPASLPPCKGLGVGSFRARVGPAPRDARPQFIYRGTGIDGGCER